MNIHLVGGQNQKPTTDATIMDLAKKGMKKYRKMLDKLSKN